jgi:hypothetical protein
MNENPEAVPNSEPSNTSVSAEIRWTPAAEQLLVKTRPWARFMSVLTFISAAFMLIAGMLISILGVGLRSIPSETGRFGTLTSAANIFAGLFYILLSFIYVAPGVFLWKFASSIRLLETSRSQQALENAMGSQRSFWRYIGILAIVGLVVGVLIIVFAVISFLILARRHMYINQALGQM